MSCNSAVVYAPEDSSEEDVSSSSTAASSVASLESHPLPPSFENPKLQYPPLPKDFPPLPLNKTPEEPAYAVSLEFEDIKHHLHSPPGFANPRSLG